jgi:hypothetical protein
MNAAMDPRPHAIVPARRAGLAQRLWALALFSVVMLAPALALAVGSVKVDTTQPQEQDGRWKLNMTIHYGGTPHVGHVPMVFQFTQTMHYERALTDESPEKPIERRVPLQGQQPINEDMDVGFSDPSGKLFDRTKFSFVIRRDRGFEAGEYTLKITRSSDGATMGQPLKLVLKGENPVVDRRAIVFVANDKKKKKKEEAPDGAAAESAEPAGDDDGGGIDEGIDDTDLSEPDGPPAEPPKQGGCGCRAVGLDPTSGGWGGWLAVLAAGIWLRRRRSA